MTDIFNQSNTNKEILTDNEKKYYLHKNRR